MIGEVAPKTFAVQHTERAALSVTPLLWFLTQFAPLRWLSKLLIGVANVVLPGKGLKAGSRSSPRRRSARWPTSPPSEDAIEREEQALIHSIFEFGDTVVREVMLPQPRRRDRRLRRHDRGGHRRPPSNAGFSRLPCREGGRRHHRPRLPEGPRAAGARRVRATNRCAPRCGRRRSCPSRSGSPSCCARCAPSTSTWRS